MIKSKMKIYRKCFYWEFMTYVDILKKERIQNFFNTTYLNAAESAQKILLIKIQVKLVKLVV